MKTRVLLLSMASVRTMRILRWSMWPMLHKANEDLNRHHGVIVAKSLTTLQNIITRNLATIANMRIILSKTIVCDSRINRLLLFIMLFSLTLQVSTASLDQLSASCFSTPTPERVQRMIICALSTLSVQGKNNLFTSLWLVNCGFQSHDWQLGNSK